jgi:hypothetical protein
LDLSADWQDTWKRQMEVYQWLLRGNDFDVSKRGYFVYANADKSLGSFDRKLVFDLQLLPYDGDDQWIDDTLVAAKECLMSEDVPEAREECDYCTFRDVSARVIAEAEGEDVPDQELPF